jgi:hypothetical protein
VGRFTLDTQSSQYKLAKDTGVPEVVRALRADPLWQTAPVVVSFSREAWPDGLGLLVQLERHGSPVYAEAREDAFLVPPDLRSDRWADAGRVLRVHVDRPAGRKEGVLWADDKVAFQRVEARYTPGTTIRPGDPGAEGYLLEGWSRQRFRLRPGVWGRCLRDSAGRLALGLGRPATAPLTLWVEASPMHPNEQPDGLLEVSVNGEGVASWPLPRYDPPREDAVRAFLRERGQFRVAVPPEVLNRQSPVVMELRMRDGLPEGYRRLPHELPSYGLLVTGVRLSEGPRE